MRKHLPLLKFAATILSSLSDCWTQTRLILDGISIRMSKLCTTSICKPLQILYKNCFDNACFPQTWKNANIIPIQKKGKKQLKKKHLACLVIAYFEKKLKKNKRNLIHYLNFWMMTDSVLKILVHTSCQE